MSWMDEPAVELQDVHLSLGRGAARVHILKGLSLSIVRGETVGLVGPSGSGKSTLLMVLAGLERADSGAVRVAGQSLEGLSEDQLARFRGQNIGIVFQSFHLIPTMTALENVAIPLELAGDPDAFFRAEAELQAVGLKERLRHYPAQLSGGEQQRVALARALAPNPSILVADEPTGNLDAATGESIIELMFALRRDRGATLVLVTHDPTLAARCDRTVKVNSGRIRARRDRGGQERPLQRIRLGRWRLRGFDGEYFFTSAKDRAIMSWRRIKISRFGGPEVLEIVTETTVPDPGPGEVRIKVLAAGAGFTDAFIRRGRYPDFKGPLPFTPGYELVGLVEKTGSGVETPREGQMVADLCVVGGYAQYAIRPARYLVPVPDGVDPAEAACIPLAYLTAFQMLTRYRHLPRGSTILAIGGSGAVGTALLDLARYLGLKAIGTCSAANLPVVERFGGKAVDYRAGDFVGAVRHLASGRAGGAGVDAAFDAIGGAHFERSFASLAPGGLLIGYGSQTMAIGREGLVSAGLGLLRLKLWDRLSFLFRGRRALWYSITSRRRTHPEEFRADMAALFELLSNGTIHPLVVERLPLEAASKVHARIDAGGLGGKIVLMPWAEA